MVVEWVCGFAEQYSITGYTIIVDKELFNKDNGGWTFICHMGDRAGVVRESPTQSI